jgi:hypothetical protein
VSAVFDDAAWHEKTYLPRALAAPITTVDCCVMADAMVWFAIIEADQYKTAETTEAAARSKYPARAPFGYRRTEVDLAADELTMTPPRAAETEFNAWYDTEHVPALARVPGVLCARRFRSAGSGPAYVALYHLTTPEVVKSADWKGASESTPMPAHIRPQIADRIRFVCRRYERKA